MLLRACFTQLSLVLRYVNWCFFTLIAVFYVSVIKIQLRDKKNMSAKRLYPAFTVNGH